MKDVAFSCDDNGAKFLCVTVWSLLEHYRGDEPLRINVFEGFGGHSLESKLKLKLIVEEWNKKHALRSSTSTPNFNFFSLRYHNVEKFIAPYSDILQDRAGSRWNIFTWTPIFTPQILADAEGNVAHFDIDMLFNDDVSKILNLDLGDNLIACVAEYGKGDPVITEAVWGKGILPPEAERYFNTGTIVFNTAKCREEKTWEKILAWYREHYDIADRIEQDAWNALYWKRTRLLPLRWNFHDRCVKHFSRWNPFVRYWLGNPPRESLDAALNPAILHFWGPKKPWKPCHRPYRKLYHAAMRAVGQTPPRGELFGFWQDLSTRSRLRKIRRVLDLVCAWLPEDAVVEDPEYLLSLMEKWERRRKRKLRRQTFLLPLEWLGIGLCRLVMTNLPHRALFALADVIGAVMYRFDRQGRRRSLENLHVLTNRCTGDEGTSRFDTRRVGYRPTRREDLIIRGAYRNMSRTVAHAFWTCRDAVRRVQSVGEMDPRAAAFLAANRPAVTVSAHLGCWEILSQLAYLEGHRMMSVAKRIGTPGMTRLLMKSRQSIGQEIVPADGAFKALMAGIKSGKSLGLLVDQRVDPEEGGLWVRFCGRPLPVSAAPAFFAAKAKASIIIAWSRPLPGGRYRCEEIATIPAEEARDVWRTTQRCTACLERVIRRHPSRWVLNYNLFSNEPTEKDLATLADREAALEKAKEK